MHMKVWMGVLQYLLLNFYTFFLFSLIVCNFNPSYEGFLFSSLTRPGYVYSKYPIPPPPTPTPKKYTWSPPCYTLLLSDCCLVILFQIYFVHFQDDTSLKVCYIFYKTESSLPSLNLFDRQTRYLFFQL